jgi:CTP-dependent riboflavin kinase
MAGYSGKNSKESQVRAIRTRQPGKDIHNRTSRNGSQTRIEQSGHEPLKYLTK